LALSLHRASLDGSLALEQIRRLSKFFTVPMVVIFLESNYFSYFNVISSHLGWLPVFGLSVAFKQRVELMKGYESMNTLQ